jgi:hypothetical protein
MIDLRGTAWAAVLACAAACGSVPEDRGDAPEDTATQPGDVATPAGDQISAEYLAGEWCAVEEDREPSGTTYVFATDGSYSFGREGNMSEGPGLDAFLQSIDVISVEADQLVASQMGRRLVMTRGACAPR